MRTIQTLGLVNEPAGEMSRRRTRELAGSGERSSRAGSVAAAGGANALELDPRYCDVIVNRWESVTGKKATRL